MPPRKVSIKKNADKVALPTAKLREALQSKFKDSKVDQGAATCLAAVLDYATCEVLERAGNIARNRERRVLDVVVTETDVQDVLRMPDLAALFQK